MADPKSALAAFNDFMEATGPLHYDGPKMEFKRRGHDITFEPVLRPVECDYCGREIQGLNCASCGAARPYRG